MPDFIVQFNLRNKLLNTDICLFIRHLMRTVLPLLGFLFLLSFNGFSQSDTVFVYYLRGCERCNQTEKFLNENKVLHKQHYTDVQDDYRKLVKIMDGVGFKNGQTLSFPVVVYKGKTHFNIQDLDAFLKSQIMVN